MQSKFPHIGTTIFSLMSQEAAKYGAINLSQGFPDFEMDSDLIELCAQAMRQGENQYAASSGYLPLRQAIAEKIFICYGVEVNPETEITLTCGATEALFDAIAAVVFAGDEVIVIEPCYDSYLPAIELCGGKAVCVQMETDFSIDWQKVEQAITPKTKAIITNTPHNPTGMVLGSADIKELEKLCQTYDLFIVSDEVYEHLIFDNKPHESVLKSEILRQRAFAIYSFGKTYHCTGWKLGYCVAVQQLTREFRKIHQYITFSSFSPAQVALSQYLSEKEKYLSLSGFYQTKRDYFLKLTQGLPFRFLPCQGSYFALADYSSLSQLPDKDFAYWMVQQVGVAVIPVSSFYSNATQQQLIRFCFAKKNQTLELAAERMNKIFLG